MNIRPPAVAGTFYPSAPERLRTTVAALLAGVAPSAVPPPKALIAPHAGYAYSGAVAAAAFATLRHARRIERVVLIGPAHYVRLAGVAVPTADAFATPLGPVSIDRQALAAIADLAVVAPADAAHAPEHALEVELPFLQAVLGRFAIVPLLVGEAGPAAVRRGAATAVGRRRNADRRQLRPLALPQLRHRPTARCRNRRGDRAR
jgi:AmmeMemoRadiSam system protein B